MTPFRWLHKVADRSSRPARVAALVVRVLLGVFFVVSAVAKWVDIDRFEVHVFSYNLLPLGVSLVVARLIIVAEILVGVGLIANIWHKFVNVCAVLMLVGFTLFLGYAALVGRTDSCQCSGPLLEMNPVQSMLKNAVLLLLLWISMYAKAWSWRPKWWLWLPAVLAVPVTLFITSAPDNWLFGPGDEIYGVEALNKGLSDEGELGPLNLDEGRHVVAFVTVGCQFCRMADQKLTSIWERGGLDSSALTYLVTVKDTTTPPLTMVDTVFQRPAYVVGKETFMMITYGQRPMVMLLEDGEVKGSFHYRNIDEEQIVRFLKDEK